MKSYYFKSVLLSVLGSSFLFFISCKDDNGGENQIADNAYINSWIFENMTVYYLWNDDMPTDVDFESNPTDFFNSLKVPQDRFSRIFPNYAELIASLSGENIESGYEFTLAANGNEVISIVAYVKENSPADMAGLMRGDRIYKINGQSMTVDNYRDIVVQAYADHSIEYARYDSNTETYIDQGEVSIAIQIVEENPNYLDSVYTIQDKRIGYYVYNFFAGGSTIDYNAQMDNIIEAFKNKNITDLVLDLRYNGGGYISSATNLASLIGSNISASDTFYEYEFNAYIQSGLNPEDNKEKFLSKTQNIGSLINGQIYVLVGGGTASASELVINGLSPFMNVTLIGETTIGKNVGSLPIEDEQNPDNLYGLLPIVFYISNSQGFNDYGDGFIPNAENVVNERTTPMYALGDSREALLSHAIGAIIGSDVVARKRNADGPVLLGTSLQNHVRFGHSILNGSIKK